jgi:plastocyanin domain-containing protein
MKLFTALGIFVIFTFITITYVAGQAEKIYKASVDEDGIQRITVLGGNYFYDPDYIIVKVNVPVELIMQKESGIVPHNIVIQEPEAGMDIRESMISKPQIITFTPAKVGRYPFYCDKKLFFFKSHREKGMEGILEVIE